MKLPPFLTSPTDGPTRTAALVVLAAEAAVVTPTAFAGWDAAALLALAVVVLVVSLVVAALVSTAKPHHVLITSAGIAVAIVWDVLLVLRKHTMGAGE